jgi:hypothetical protein
MATRRLTATPDADALARSPVEWLLASEEPAIRLLARRDLLGEDVDDPEAVLSGPKVQALLSNQRRDGGFGVHPYHKWTGAHWRLVSLVELGAPAGDPRLVAAASTVLDWLTGPPRRIRVVDGLTRRHASMEGNALAVCCRLGIADDERVDTLARDLVAWQWPDGGWNCDVRATGRRSSFHESLIPAWGLHEYWRTTGAGWARDAALRTAQLLLDHRVFRSLATGEPIDPRWLRLRYPPYWHYDVLHALLVLSRLGVVDDPRAADALAVLRKKRLPDGRWRVDGKWWSPPGRDGARVEVVHWGRSVPNEMVTLNGLRVMAAAGGRL